MNAGAPPMLSARAIRGWYRVHKWTSLVCTAFLLMLCITGLPLVFHEEIDAWLDNVDVPALPTAAPDASLDRVVAAARRRHPGEVVQYLYYDDDVPHVVRVAMAPALDAPPAQVHALAVDARTAQVLQDDPPEHGFMQLMLRLHVDLFAGLPGELFLGAMGLLFVAAIVSGVVVYGPMMRKLRFGTVRLRRSRRLRWLDLHNLLGIVTVAWALVVGATGVINTLSVPLFSLWRAQALPALATSADGVTPDGTGSVEAALDAARRALPHNRVTTVVFPGTPFGSPHDYLVWTRGDTPLTSQLFTPVVVDGISGRLRAVARMPWYLRTLEVARPLHFGDYGGVPLKVIWALLDSVTIVVLVSGLYLWWGRRRSPIESRIAELQRSGLLGTGEPM